MSRIEFTLGTVIRLMREQRGLGQTDLGIHKMMISKIERGETTKPAKKTMDRIAKSLGVTVEEIYAEVDRLNGLSAGDLSGDVVGFGNNILGSNNIVGSNYGSVAARPGQERAISDEAAELVRIYKSLDLRGRVKILDLAVTLKEAAEKGKQE